MYSSLFILTGDGITIIIKVKKGITPANGYLPQQQTSGFNRLRFARTKGGYFFCSKRTNTMSRTKNMFISFMGHHPHS